MRIGLAGGAGFVGSAIEHALGDTGVQVVNLPRVPTAAPRAEESIGDAARRAEGAAAEQLAALDAALSDVTVVINAAGRADPDSLDAGELLAGNAVLPVVLARAAARAGVERLVHVSSAAVLGSAPVYDERVDTEPDTPYSVSKAAGEAALGALGNGGPDSLVIYRPTSVCGIERAATRRLVAMLDRRVLPTTKGGSTELPLVSVGNVARVAVWLATNDIEDDADPGGTAARVVLHPSEGVDQNVLFATLAPGARRVPIGPLATLIRLGSSTAPARIRPAVRRLDVLVNGRPQISSLRADQLDLEPAASWLGALGAERRP